MADLGLRFMWWGGRSDRRDNNDSGGIGAIIAILALVLLLLAPFAAQLMQFAMSRRRELLADASGVQLTRYPPGLISALEKLQGDQAVVHHATPRPRSCGSSHRSTVNLRRKGRRARGSTARSTRIHRSRSASPP